MNSLKSIIPALSNFLLFSEHALYERQRALVRGGLLKAKEGRGPGSGVKATPESVAMLVISVLATDSLSDVIAETSTIAKAPRLGNDFATSQAMPALRTFKAAVVHCFSSDGDDIRSIKVYRMERAATIGLRDGGSVTFGKSKIGTIVEVTAELNSVSYPHIRGLIVGGEPFAF
jgi:hypothetical protein